VWQEEKFSSVECSCGGTRVPLPSCSTSALFQCDAFVCHLIPGLAWARELQMFCIANFAVPARCPALGVALNGLFLFA